jgi:hypothetical protein
LRADFAKLGTVLRNGSRIEGKTCVNAELREKLILKTEQVFMLAGAESYDQAMQQFGKMLEFLNSHYDPMRTKEQLRTLLDQMPEPSFMQRRLLFGVLKYLPQIMRFGLKRLAETAEFTLPEIPTGRPGLELQIRTEIVEFVGNQHKRVPSLDRCMKSAAQKFGVSKGTVQRAWDDRASLDDADFRSALKFLRDGPRD